MINFTKNFWFVNIREVTMIPRTLSRYTLQYVEGRPLHFKFFFLNDILRHFQKVCLCQVWFCDAFSRNNFTIDFVPKITETLETAATAKNALEAKPATAATGGDVDYFGGAIG